MKFVEDSEHKHYSKKHVWEHSKSRCFYLPLYFVSCVYAESVTIALIRIIISHMM